MSLLGFWGSISTVIRDDAEKKELLLTSRLEFAFQTRNDSVIIQRKNINSDNKIIKVIIIK